MMTNRRKGGITLLEQDMIRGHTDGIILSCLTEKDSYGYEINKTVRLITGGALEMKEATLYTAFRRLEDAGCITSYWGGEESGARRKYYSITDVGRSTYRTIIRQWKETRETLDKLLKEI